MKAGLPAAERFSFVLRPVPVPGDLRIAWRLALLQLMLATSRGKRASLIKLHILNQALRDPFARARLHRAISLGELTIEWRMRIEPAFGRAIDFLIGEGLAEWIPVAGRTGLRLTAIGLQSYEIVHSAEEILQEEKEYLRVHAAKFTENFVSGLIKGKSVQ